MLRNGPDIGRLVSFAPIGSGCQEGGVRLQQQPVERQPGCHLVYPCICKACNASDTEIEPQIQCPPSLIFRTCKTVPDPFQGAILLMLEDVQQVIRTLPVVQNDRFVRLFCDLTMMVETLFLLLHKLGAPVVIRSEEHTSELQSRGHLVCRLLL